MDTSRESLTPLSADTELSSEHFTFSPLEYRKLSMPSCGESDFEENGEKDEDCGVDIKDDSRMKHLWDEISDFREKTTILQKKDYDLRRVYKQRDGAIVYKCILHANCEFLVRIRCEGISTHHFFCVPLIVKNAEDLSDCLTQADTASYVIDTSGTHSTTLMLKKTGIHSVWLQRIDELLESGVMPGKIMLLLHKEALDTTRPLLPTLAQIHNRKRKVFKSTTNLSSQHALTSYMRKRMVIKMYLPTNAFF